MNLSLLCKNSNLKPKVDSFREGVREFTVQELSDIKLYLLTLKDTLTNTAFYTGTVKDQKVVSCFAEDFYEELLNHMIFKLDAKVAIIVILSQKRVILTRNSKTCTLDLCNLAKIICDGECDDASINFAEGTLTKTFLNFSKTLTPC